jgi:acyl-CoA carboxylase epsilon subunit-like protein
MEGLRIVRGEPDDHELAALAAVLCAVLARRESGPAVRGTRSAPPTGAPWARDAHYLAPGSWTSDRDYPSP